jgi:hypothetical protein
VLARLWSSHAWEILTTSLRGIMMYAAVKQVICLAWYKALFSTVCKVEMSILVP